MYINVSALVIHYCCTSS